MCPGSYIFWQHQEHEVAYSSLRTFKMWPGSCVLGTRRVQSGPQLAPSMAFKMWLGSCILGTRRVQSGLQLALDINKIAWEWCPGDTKSTKWLTVGSGHSKCCLGVVFGEHEEHKVAYSWIRALILCLGNGVPGTRRAQRGLQLVPGTQNVAWEWCPGKMHHDSGQELHTF